MVLIEEFSESQTAREVQDFLLSLGIVSRIAVDPLSCRAPALSTLAELGLFVEGFQVEKALAALKTRKVLKIRAA